MGNKNKILAIIFGALIISVNGNALAYTPIGQDYHEVATKEEHKLAEGAWKETVQQYYGNVERSTLLENKIQAPLIKYNPDKLKKANSPYDDGLYNVYVANDFQTTSDTSGGECVSNYIYLTKSHINENWHKTKDYDVYGMSVIASTYAHEAGHWYYNDTFNRTNRETDNETQKAKERRADSFSNKIVDNVPNFSVGGYLIDYQNWDFAPKDHPSHAERWLATHNYISNNCNGRVFFEKNKRFTNHLIISTQGYDIEVSPPDQYSPETILNNKVILTKDINRAYYVAGTVAWAIKNNAWNVKNVTYEDAHKYFKDLPANVKATAIIATKGSKYKIIDWYFSEEYLNESQKQALNDYLICLNASIEGSDFLKAVNK